MDRGHSYEKGHPHVHLVFWDGNQGIKDYFVQPETVNGIRKKLIQSVFRDELEALYFSKNEAKAGIRVQGGAFFDDFTNRLDEMNGPAFLRYRQKILAVSRAHNLSGVAFSGFSKQRLNEIAKELYALKSLLPKRGSLKYAYLPEDAKRAVDRLSLKMLNSGKDLATVFERYVNAEAGIAAMYTSNPQSLYNAKEKAVREGMKMVGNQIIGTIRELNQKEWDAKGEEYRQETAKGLMLDIFALLFSASRQSEARHGHMRATGELSKQAKRELAKELESKGLEWGD
jgi:hypothetical protein